MPNNILTRDFCLLAYVVVSRLAPATARKIIIITTLCSFCILIQIRKMSYSIFCRVNNLYFFIIVSHRGHLVNHFVWVCVKRRVYGSYWTLPYQHSRASTYLLLLPAIKAIYTYIITIIIIIIIIFFIWVYSSSMCESYVLLFIYFI